MLAQKKLDAYLFLIETEDDLNRLQLFFDKISPQTPLGLDTETTGVDYLKDSIVGFCLSIYHKGKYKGWYLPVRHFTETNLPLLQTLKFIDTLCHKHPLYLFNRPFDFFFLEKEGIDLSKVISHDVQIMVWEATSEGMPSLKGSYKTFLKKEVPTFIQTVTASTGKVDYNFGNTDPRTSFTYAAYDPVATLELGEHMMRKFSYIKKIYPLDNRASEVIRNQSKIDVKIDFNSVLPFKEEVEHKLRNVRRQMFEITGYQFNPNSNREKAEALSRFVTLTDKTSSGAFSVKSEVLEKIDHPLARLLVEYAKLQKFISSYITPLESVQKFKSSTKFKWNTVAAPTARLASGGAKGNSYYIDYNIQSIPKQNEILYVHPHPHLGLQLTPSSEGALGECEVKSGFRRVFTAPEGYAFMTFDYSGQEVRLMANMAKEHVWADAFNNSEDVHMKVAELAFNERSKVARSHAKAVTFGLAYGMSTQSLAKRLNVSLARATEIVSQYFSALTNFKKWIANQHLIARKNYIIFDYYGRPRNLEPYYNTSDPHKVAFGDRSSVNSVIQSAGADILRIKLCQLFDYWHSDKDFHDNVIIPYSVYDEINFYVKYEYIGEAYRIIPQIMREEHSNWLCPLIVEGGIGTSWGTCIDNPTIENGKITNSLNIKWYE